MAGLNLSPLKPPVGGRIESGISEGYPVSSLGGLGGVPGPPGPCGPPGPPGPPGPAFEESNGGKGAARCVYTIVDYAPTVLGEGTG